MRSSLFLFAIGLLLPVAAAGCSRVTAVSGVIAGDQRWQGTVNVHGDVVIANGTLRITPGTTVIFHPASAADDRLREHPNFPGSELIVRGTLIAEGTPTAPIVFRHRDAAAPAGSWGGINLQQSPLSVFRHCLFSQADSAIHSQESKVTIEDSRFQQNIVGVRFHSSEIRIENNHFTANGTAIRFHFGSPLIRGNCIRNNGKGIFITSHPSEFHIVENDFIANRDFNVVLGEEVPDDISATGNWWGTRDPQRIESSFFDGRREPYLGRIIYAPAATTPVAGAACSR